MKIKPVDMFHTPASWPELEGWITRHPNTDIPPILTAAMMAWNLAARVQMLTPGDMDYWDNSVDDYPVQDWQLEVANGDTRQGYWEWVEARLEEAKEEEDGDVQ